VNDLKYYNDSKGHQAGDRLLQKAAESFHCITNRNVQVFRTGGDEFVGIIWNCEENGIAAVIDLWRKKLAELNADDDGIVCTIAHGAAFGSGEYKYDDVVALADERMYADKRRMKEAGLKLGEMR
jgi:diguanylate cyclase (GGDEF)-like protein